MGVLLKTTNYDENNVYKTIVNTDGLEINFDKVDLLYKQMRLNGFGSLVPDYKIINSQEMIQEKLIRIEDILCFTDIDLFETKYKQVMTIIVCFMAIYKRFSTMENYLLNHKDRVIWEALYKHTKGYSFMKKAFEELLTDKFNFEDLFNFCLNTICSISDTISIDVILNEIVNKDIKFFPKVSRQNIKKD